MAGFGGLIRDVHGNFLKGFHGYLGNSTIMHAELMIIFHGLSLCWDLGYKRIICSYDSMNTLKLIDSVDPFFHKLGNDIARIVNLLSCPWEVKVQHVFRETNFCADFMAKRGMEDTTPYVIMVDTSSNDSFAPG